MFLFSFHLCIYSSAVFVSAPPTLLRTLLLHSYCVVFMFSFRVCLCFCVLNLISRQHGKEAEANTHTHVRNTLTEAYGMCSATKLLRESLLFFFSNNFELPLALAHLYPPAASTVDLPYTLFACLIMHFNAQSMTVCLVERGCCCAGEMAGRAAGRQGRCQGNKNRANTYSEFMNCVHAQA